MLPRAVLAAAALLATLAPAALAGGVSVAATPKTVKRGQHVRLRGEVPPGQCRVVHVVSEAFPAIHLDGNQPSVTVSISKTGHFSKLVLVPASRATGRYVVTMTCDGGSLGVISYLHVTA